MHWAAAARQLLPDLYDPYDHTSAYAFFYDAWPLVGGAQGEGQLQGSFHALLERCIGSRDPWLQAATALAAADALPDLDDLPAERWRQLPRAWVTEALLPLARLLHPRPMYLDLLAQAGGALGAVRAAGEPPTAFEPILGRLQQLQCAHPGVGLAALMHIAGPGVRQGSRG